MALGKQIDEIAATSPNRTGVCITMPAWGRGGGERLGSKDACGSEIQNPLAC